MVKRPGQSLLPTLPRHLSRVLSIGAQSTWVSILETCLFHMCVFGQIKCCLQLMNYCQLNVIQISAPTDWKAIGLPSGQAVSTHRAGSWVQTPGDPGDGR